MGFPVKLAESGLLPDQLVRYGIRQICRRRLAQEKKASTVDRRNALRSFLEEMRQSPVAVTPELTKRQHYELPPDFFQLVLGKRMKYSCCLYESGSETLDEAEDQMLALTCRRAEIQDGMHILELGCGWGSLSLWLARNYWDVRITAVSNSASQGRYIKAQCKKFGLHNIEVITADMNTFRPGKTYDRILSVEMFEHMRNWHELLKRIASWLVDDGKFFIHIFSHKHHFYLYEQKDEFDWMARYFFTAGLMPSDDMLLYCQEHLILQDHWQVNGLHYQKTANQWLANLDANRDDILQILEQTYGATEAALWLQRWRLFFMACAELWGFQQGEEWLVSHYLFKKR